MRMAARSRITLPLIVMAAALWLWTAGSARAGDGGEDAGTVQTFLNSVCGVLGITSCPQLPTITQGVLEIAGLVYARPEAIRRSQNITPGSVYANNPPPIPANPVVPLVLPVTPSAFANLALTPLAFISAPATPGLATPTQLYNSDADTFFSAVTTFGSVQEVSQPQVLNLFYDDLRRQNRAFTKGQIVADFSLPLVVLNSDGSERPAPTTLQIKSCANGPANCFLANATGDFLGNGVLQPQNAADIGVNFALVFGASPTSSRSHAIFEIQVPLVVTAANDPTYFGMIGATGSFSCFFAPLTPQDCIIGSVTFSADDVGFTPTKAGILPAGASIGIAPYPAPATAFLPPSSPPPSPPPTSNFGFCANLPDNSNGPHADLRPAIAAFLGVATDGETLVSTPLSTSTNPTLQCPF